MASPSIQAIDAGSVHRICSGQVVLDLTTAVKELLENSVDAQATNVEVRLKEHGKEYIEVIDNGTGIDECDFESLALKHHTSKLRQFSDLTVVETFGFRGEALSSLTALADIVVTTRKQESQVAYKLTFEHSGVLATKSAAARAYGTTVNVSNLFHTLPVRYKEFQRNAKKEFSKMMHVLYAYSLINSDVRFTCINQMGSKKKVMLSTNGSRDVLAIISSIFGPAQSKMLLEIKTDGFAESVLEEFGLSRESVESVFTIVGYVSEVKHGSGRNAPDRQFFFINKRPCDFPKLARVINNTFHEYNRHQYPFVFLDISLTRDCVDVNLTPNKRQILVHQEKLLYALVKSSLKKLFENSATFFQDNTSNALHDTTLRDDLNKSNTLDTQTSLKMFLRSKFEAFNNSADDSSKNRGIKRLLEDKHELSDKCVKVSEHKENETLNNWLVTPYSKQNVNEENKHFENTNNSLCSNESTYPKDESPKRTIITEKNEENNVASKDEEIDNNNHVTSLVCEKIKEQTIGPDKESQLLESETTKMQDNLTPEIFTRVINDKPTVSEDCYITNDKTRRSVEFDMTKVRRKFLAQKNAKDENSALFRSRITPAENSEAEGELRKHVTKETFREMHVIGQFNLGFIVAKHQRNLFLIDQHATDEKYNFETLQQKQMICGQRLINPLPLQLTLVNQSILVDNLSVFQRNGFDISVEEVDGIVTTKLLSMPTCGNWTFDVADVEELIFMLADAPGVMCRPSRVRKMFASRACRSSVMVGTALNKVQMTRLIRHMAELDHPWNCPHGRPTMRHLVSLRRINTNV